MALFAGDKHYCKICWFENGRMMVRRVYQLTIQQPSGVVRHLTGRELPDAIVIQTGPSARGKASMEVLTLPNNRAAEDQIGGFPIEPAWPRRRDLMHMGAGLVFLGLIRFFVLAAELSQ